MSTVAPNQKRVREAILKSTLTVALTFVFAIWSTVSGAIDVPDFQKVASSASRKVASTLHPAEAGYEKEGYPCIKGLCVNDGLEELENLQWKKQILIEKHPRLGSTAYKADEDTLLAAQEYIQRHMFDATALPLISRIAAVCRKPDTLKGEIVDEGSTAKTFVEIQLRPDVGNLKRQRWTVVAITKYLTDAVTPEQQAEALDQVKTRYGSLYSAHGPQGLPFVTPAKYLSPGGAFGYVLHYPYNVADMRSGGHSTTVDKPEDWLQAEACGGAKKVGID